MQLRPAIDADCGCLLRWRNDPLTCSMSITTDTVAEPDHIRWFHASLKNPLRKILMAEKGLKIPVGTVRFDITPEAEIPIEMSWTMAPEHRGKGWGVEMVKAAMPARPVKCSIKAENAASQRIAYAAGFRLIEDGDLQTWVFGA